LRALAVFGDKRLIAFPDVPTLKELGYKIEARALYGISAPKNTPKEVVDAIYLAAKKASEKYQTQMSDSLSSIGAQIALLDPKEYAVYLADQKAMFTNAKETLKLSE
jgi:tripartite-type tricarboxylate transporter receptor subunit TctC